MENQTVTPVQPQMYQPAPSTSQQPMPTVSKPSKTKTVILTVLLVLTLVGAAVLGYLYKTTNDTVKTKSQQLAAAYTTVGEFQAVINSYEAENTFIAQQNNADMSRRLCSGRSMAMFDVHLNDKYAVFRYLCEKGNDPIRIAALQKSADGSYEFTYGASSANPDGIPDYIYNSEPNFYGNAYGATKL